MQNIIYSNNINSQLDNQKSKLSMRHIELICALTSGILILSAWFTHDIKLLSLPLFILSFLIGGFAKGKEGIEKTIENKTLNVEMLMIFAAIGAAAIGYWLEGAMLIFIFSLSGALETYTMEKSEKEITSLMKLQPEEAHLLVHQDTLTIAVSKLKIGDTILIKPGERIPADGQIIEGQSTIDESAISGESVPIYKNVEKEVFAGTVNISGLLKVRVLKEATDSLLQKIVSLVEEAKREKSDSQLFIEKFEDKYVKVVIAFFLLTAILPALLLEWSWTESMYRATVLLVVASPCALVASIMPATLSAIANGAKQGILFKGGKHIEQLASLTALAFDKTGTLTIGKPTVTDFIVEDNQTRENLLQAVASIENQSNHPLAKAIVQFAKENNSAFIEVTDLVDVPGKGVRAKINKEQWEIGNADFVYSQTATLPFKKQLTQCKEEAKTIVYVKHKEKIVAFLALKDVVRRDSVQTLQRLQKKGIFTTMITGDEAETALAIQKETGIQSYIAKCLPQEKSKQILKLKENYKYVGMVGDGINDAPALANANVGIAVGGGTDIALETADIVLMNNDLSKINDAIRISQKLNRIIKQNIFFSTTIILILILTNYIQIIDLPLGVIGHEGSTLLVILNGLRLLKS